MKKKILIQNYRDTFVKTNKEAQQVICKLLKLGYEIDYFNIEGDEDTLPQYTIKATFDDGKEG